MKETKKESSKKKSGSVVGFILSTALFILVIFVFFLVLQAKKENKPITVFGRFFSIVVSPSMEPEIKVGDLIVVKLVDMNSVEVGENVVFVSVSGEISGQRIVHEVIEKGTDETGLYFKTKGINNTLPDTEKVRESNFVGIEAGHSSFWGKFFGFFTRIENLILLVVLILVAPFAVGQIKKIIVYSKEAKSEANALPNASDDINKSEINKEESDNNACSHQEEKGIDSDSENV
ncbi:MAG: signal peptidase I [Clostridia bacterium]|nr:signal peptidase I [Clostridia bacterium]